MSLNQFTYLSNDQLVLAKKKHWLISGAAGFIGSHLVETLLRIGCKVRGMDNLESANDSNLRHIQASVSKEAWLQFEFIKGDIRDSSTCLDACQGIDTIVHLAAKCSVPDSISHPLVTHEINVSGFVNMLKAAVDSGIKRFVFASSCAVYGDSPSLPKREDMPLFPLSPYALSKQMNELYASMFNLCYGIQTVGLRYFNVYGSRQSLGSSYASVIPTWFHALKHNESIFINGDGETTRDFCHIDDITHANILAGIMTDIDGINRVYNIGCEKQISLNELLKMMIQITKKHYPLLATQPIPIYRGYRAGDIKHSVSDISQARKHLHYQPDVDLEEGLSRTVRHYFE